MPVDMNTLPTVGAEEMSDHRMPSRLDFTLGDFPSRGGTARTFCRPAPG